MCFDDAALLENELLFIDSASKTLYHRGMKLYPIYDQYTKDIWMSIPYLLLAIGCGAGLYYLTGIPALGFGCIMAIIIIRIVVVVVRFHGSLPPCPDCGAKSMFLQRENKNLLYGCQKYVLKCQRCGTMLYTDMAMKRSFPFGWQVRMSEEEVERDMQDS